MSKKQNYVVDLCVFIFTFEFYSGFMDLINKKNSNYHYTENSYLCESDGGVCCKILQASIMLVFPDN